MTIRIDCLNVNRAALVAAGAILFLSVAEAQHGVTDRNIAIWGNLIINAGDDVAGSFKAYDEAPQIAVLALP